MAASIIRMYNSFCHVAPPHGPRELPNSSSSACISAAEVGWGVPPIISSRWPELECVAAEEAENVVWVLGGFVPN